MGLVNVLRSLPRRFRDSIEQEGWRRFLLRSAASPVYRAGALNVRPLQRFEGGKPSCDIRSATLAEIPALVALRPEYRARELASRLNRGEECLLAFAGDALVGCRWTARGQAHMDWLGLVLPLGERELYAYEIYVHPGQRRRGVSAALTRAYHERYLALGFETTFSFASLGRRPFGKRDPHTVATVRTYRLGPFRVFRLRMQGPQGGRWRQRLGALRWGKPE